MHLSICLSLLPLFALVATSPAALNPAAEPAGAALEARQGAPPPPDVTEILQLASLAGVVLPTNDPALLLSLGPIAEALASQLPTAPVLSVLETAAPSDFLSRLVNDPVYASSIMTQFEAGHPPGWFTSLPTGVLSYLHTYTNWYGYVSIISAATEGEKAATMTTATMTGTVTTTVTGSAAATSTGSATATSTGSVQDLRSVSATTGAGSATGSTTAGTSTSTAGAAKETGLLAAGAMAVAGILGLAVAL